MIIKLSIAGLAIAIVPCFVADSNIALNISSVVTGLFVAELSLLRGPKTETYGMFGK